MPLKCTSFRTFKNIVIGGWGGALEGGTLLLGNDKNNIVADKDQVVFRV